ncbi:MAG: hypothetical protein ACI3VZ_06465 [Faecousia sp.]
MRDKLTYDKSRHFNIKSDGRNAKILNYRFVSLEGTPCLILKTKITNNISSNWDVAHILEIPTDSGLLTVTGKICAVCSSPTVSEFHYEVISQSVTASHN